MTRHLSLIACPLLLAGCMTTGAESDDAATAAPSARAVLSAPDGTPRGSATIAEAGGGLRVHVEATGLSPGVHGLHLHTTGRCDAPDFQTAGGHWNPTARQHGRDNPEGAHSGDMPNIEIGADGRGVLDFTTPGATLSGLLDADGAALVIHASADDYRTDPSGNSGGRIACGVVTR
jgi:Cu-Zn family superoxide dismutase